MNAALIVLACVAAASCTVVAPVHQQYYVPTTHSAVQYVQQPHAVKYVQPSYVSSVAGVPTSHSYVYNNAAVPSTQQYVYNTAAVPSYYTSPVASTAYGYSAYSPSYYYPSVYGYGYVKK